MDIPLLRSFMDAEDRAAAWKNLQTIPFASSHHLPSKDWTL